MKKLLTFFSQLSVIRHGQIMIVALVILAIVLILAASLFDVTSRFIGFFSKSVLNEQATQLAEAGIDYAVQKLNDTTGNYLSQPGATETRTLSTGEIVIKIDAKSQNLKTITATGYVPNISSPRAKRTVKVDALIDTQQISFRYAVQVGAGGINMANSSLISGTSGTKATVYTNGSINGSGSSIIDGDAYAVGTISSPDPLVTGIKCAGQNPSVPPCPGPTNPSQMPTIDETDWLAKADVYPTTCLCTISSDTTIGPKKYIGDLTISNNAVVTVNGPIHVTGNFIMTQGSTKLKLNESFGSNGTGIVVDGKIDLSQGGQFEPTSANPIGYLLVISHSNASDALQITQSGSTAIFYALNGGATMSQSAHVSALVANQLTLSQSASLEYDQGLASANFSSGPGGSWQVKKGTYYAAAPPAEDKNLIAVYDATLKAPVCAAVGISCDSGETIPTLQGRDNVAGMVEQHTPNTIDNCTDNTGVNQSRIDRIKVITQDGSAFKAGTSSVYVELWGFFEALDPGSEGLVEVWYKNGTSTPPYFARIGGSAIFDPDGDPGAFHIYSNAFPLTGSAGNQVVRVQYRDHNYPTQGTACSNGLGYTDESDDLVFKVGS